MSLSNSLKRATIAAPSATPVMSVSISAQADRFNAVHVMTDNLGDCGFNDPAATGFHRAEQEGAKVRLLQASPTDPQLWRQSLEAVSNSGDWNVIFTCPTPLTRRRRGKRYRWRRRLTARNCSGSREACIRRRRRWAIW